MLVKTLNNVLKDTFGIHHASFFYYTSRENASTYNSLTGKHDDKTLSQLNEYAKSIGAVKVNLQNVYYRTFN